MRRLAEIVTRNREHPETERLNDREIIKESLEQFSSSKVSAVQNLNGQNDANSPLPTYAQNASAETKLEIEYLLDIALHKGLDVAFREAEKSNDFVKDAFRDALAGRLHEDLKAMGILK